MLRLIAAAAVFTVCALFGAVHAERLRLRLRLFNELERDLASIETSLRLEHADAAAVVKKLAENGMRKDLWDAVKADMDRGSAFQDAWKHSLPALMLDAEAAAPLIAFAEGFGSGDIEAELDRTALARTRFCEAGARMRTALESKIRVYRAIGALAGAAAALLML